MMVIFLVGCLLVLAMLMVVAVALIVRVIEWLAELMLRSAAATTVGFAVYWLIGPEAGDPSWPALGIMLVAVITTGWLMQRRGKSRGDSAGLAQQRAAASPPPAISETIGLCWEDATRLLSVSAIAPVRARCDRLLTASDADPLDITLLDWAEFIRHRVPELISVVGALWAVATPTERRILLDDLTRDLAAIASEADSRMTAKRRTAHERLALLRVHIAGSTVNATHSGAIILPG